MGCIIVRIYNSEDPRRIITMHNSERRARGSPVAVAPESNRGHHTNSRRIKKKKTQQERTDGAERDFSLMRRRRSFKIRAAEDI